MYIYGFWGPVNIQPSRMLHFTFCSEKVAVPPDKLYIFKNIIFVFMSKLNIKFGNILKIEQKKNNLSIYFISHEALALKESIPNSREFQLVLDIITIATLKSNTEDDPYILSLPFLGNCKAFCFTFHIYFLDNHFNLPTEQIVPFSFRSSSQISVKIFTKTEKMTEYKFNSFKTFGPFDVMANIPKNYKSVIMKDVRTPHEIYYVKLPFERVEICTMIVNLLDENGNPSGNSLELMNYFELYFITEERISCPITNEAVLTLKMAFQVKIQGKGNKQIRILLRYLSQCMSAFSKSEFYAPFTSICQSTGSGKSRLALECGKYIPLIYGVFRAESDNGFPPLSHWILQFYKWVNEAASDDFDSSDTQNLNTDNSGVKFRCDNCLVGRVLIYILALLQAYEDIYKYFIELNYSPADSIRKASSWFSSEAGQKAFATFVKPDTFKNDDVKAILSQIKAKTLYFNSIVASIYENSSDPLFKAIGRDLPFLLVFDEATVLLEIESTFRLNMLFIIRRALHHISPDSKLLCLAIGTNSDVSIIHRSVHDDSLRFIDKKALLPPFVISSNWDIRENELKLENEFVLNFETVKSPRMMNIIGTLGRPMWQTLNLTSLFQVSLCKLINGSGDDIYEPAMAIWGIRTSLSMNSDLILSRTLLKSHMATIISINYSNEIMYISYPSEPFLAMTARYVLKTKEKFKLVPFFNALLRYVKGRPIDKGRIVESIFSQILLIAVDKSPNVASLKSEIPEQNGNELVQKLLKVYNFLLENEEIKSANLNEIFTKDELNQKQISKKSDNEKDMDIINDSYDLIKEVSEIKLTEEMKSVDTKTVGPLPLTSDFYTHYHLTTVEYFLTGIYGKAKFEAMRNDLPKKILEGLINMNHTICLDDQFPFEKVYNDNVVNTVSKGIPHNASKHKCTNLIDRALLRYAFLRMAGLKTPPNYMGYDLIIPVLIQREKYDNENVKDDIFTFIGVQYKSYFKNEKEVIEKMDARKHYIQCPHHANNNDKNYKKCCDFGTEIEDLEIIYQNQLTLYLSAEIGEILESKQDIEDSSESDAKKQRSSKIFATEQIENFKFKESIIRDGNQTCIVTKSISELVGNCEFINAELHDKII